MSKEALLMAVKAALDGNWHNAHNIAQEYSDDVTNANLANWLHAVLHKIEGDECNSKYWYARTSIKGAHGKKYEDFADTNTELQTILNHLNKP